MCICLCFDVSKSEVKKAIRDGYDSIEKLSEHMQTVIAEAVSGVSRKSWRRKEPVVSYGHCKHSNQR
ncbi:MAG TPA: (2Fe-2S)-binding protein [Methylobacter sp.]|jgi:hypothetical protein